MTPFQINDSFSENLIEDVDTGESHDLAIEEERHLRVEGFLMPKELYNNEPLTDEKEIEALKDTLQR